MRIYIFGIDKGVSIDIWLDFGKIIDRLGGFGCSHIAIRQATNAHGIANIIIIIMCGQTRLHSLPLFLLDCIVDLNLIIKTFL